MIGCDYFIGDIVRPKGFILTDSYILGLPTGMGTMNTLSNLVFKEVMRDAGRTCAFSGRKQNGRRKRRSKLSCLFSLSFRFLIKEMISRKILTK